MSDEQITTPTPKSKKTKKSTQSTKVKCWLYTKFNYPLSADHPVVPDTDCQYRIEGNEHCPKKGTQHIQGYVHLLKDQRFTAMCKLYPSTNWKQADGTGFSNFIYCSKKHSGGTGEYIEFGVRPKEPKKRKSPDKCFKEALGAPTVRAGCQIIQKERPRDWCLHGESIERNLKKAKIVPFRHKFEATDFNIELQLLKKTSLFYGGSNLGKSHWAAAHFKNPLIVSHIDNLKSLSPDHDGIVFDDMCFKHWPVESVIHLVDREFDRTIKVMYGTVTIPANTKKIFTHNTRNPFYKDEEIEPEQKAAIERRLQRVHIHNKIY